MTRARALAILLALQCSAAAFATQQPFRITADTVVVTVSVRDPAGNTPPLKPEDFDVRDNGVRQTVEQAAVVDLPLDLTLLLPQTWWRHRPDGAGIVSAELTKLSRESLRPSDRIRVVTSGPVEEMVPWRAGGLPIDLAAPTALEGGLADGLLIALSRRSVTERRQVVVMFEDRALERTSALDPIRLPEAARHAEATLYVIFGRPAWAPAVPAIVDIFVSRSGFTPGTPQMQGALQETARATGGDAFASAKAELDLAGAFRDMLRDFRGTYMLGFNPTNPSPGWHELKVRVNGGQKLTVRARSGYFRK